MKILLIHPEEWQVEKKNTEKRIGRIKDKSKKKINTSALSEKRWMYLLNSGRNSLSSKRRKCVLHRKKRRKTNAFFLKKEGNTGRLKSTQNKIHKS